MYNQWGLRLQGNCHIRADYKGTAILGPTTRELAPFSPSPPSAALSLPVSPSLTPTPLLFVLPPPPPPPHTPTPRAQGEPTPYQWPNVNSHFGVIDIAGFPKDNYYYYQSVFFSRGEAPVLHLLPHWNWDGGATCNGLCRQSVESGARTVDVWAYTNADDVELFLNGVSLGRQTIVACRHLKWSVPFKAGALEAKAYLKGSADVFATATVSTTGAPAAVHLAVEWPTSGGIQADGTDTALITASLVDAHGSLVPTASHPLRFELSGPGKIIGLGNGDPSSHEHDKPTTLTSGTRSAWNGLARVVVQSTSAPGTIKLMASGAGLEATTLTIRSGMPIGSAVA